MISSKPIMPVGVFGNLGKALDLKRLGMASKIEENLAGVDCAIFRLTYSSRRNGMPHLISGRRVTASNHAQANIASPKTPYATPRAATNADANGETSENYNPVGRKGAGQGQN